MKSLEIQLDRQAQFKAREELIFSTAEQLLLENGELGMTLDLLATELELAKGTLYKHFQSKDELYMLLLVRNEQSLLEMTNEAQRLFPEQIEFFMLYHLRHPQRTVLYHQIEEHLSIAGHGLQSLFRELYQIRRKRLRKVIAATEQYLHQINSNMSVRDYLAAVWAITQGAASILNSSFYQRYLGCRESLRLAYIQQVLTLPHDHHHLSLASLE